MIVVSYDEYACHIFSNIILGAHNLDGARPRELFGIEATNMLLRAPKPTSSQTYILAFFHEKIRTVSSRDLS